jgi:hypothetical protein
VKACRIYIRRKGNFINPAERVDHHEWLRKFQQISEQPMSKNASCLSARRS